MVKKKLVEALIGDGATLLRELDRQSFPVDSMFWILLPDQDYWRLVIASPIVEQQGSAPGYRRLNELLREIELAGLTWEDITLVEPESPQFRSFRSVVNGSSRLAAGTSWLEFDEAVVYRWTSASVRGELTCDVSLSELNSIWKGEQKLLKLPALLISLDERKVTLRFHPKHGPGDEIENVKPGFARALRQARPDCRINWI